MCSVPAVVSSFCTAASSRTRVLVDELDLVWKGLHTDLCRDDVGRVAVNTRRISVTENRMNEPILIDVPIDAEKRATLTTKEAALHLNRRPQTLRIWACQEDGPIRPIRVNGRLAWRVEDIRRLLGCTC